VRRCDGATVLTLLTFLTFLTFLTLSTVGRKVLLVLKEAKLKSSQVLGVPLAFEFTKPKLRRDG